MMLVNVCGYITFLLWIILFTDNIDSTYVCSSNADPCPIKPQTTLSTDNLDYIQCEPPPRTDCDPKSIYYSIDGSCNNLNNTNWGRAGLPFQSVLPQAYADNYNAQRKMKNGEELPLARNLSAYIFPDIYADDQCRDILYYGFSQFITHDSSFQVPVSTEKPCCPKGKPAAEMSYGCLPCIVSPTDPFYAQYNMLCLENTRTADTKYMNCSGNKPVQGFNYQTSWWDLSFVYGCTPEYAQQVRLTGTPLLRTVNPTNNGSTQYFNYPDIRKSCPFGGLTPNAGDPCFTYADNRTNQNSELLLIYSLYLSLHNIVAQQLASLNPQWTTEIVFQEARRIGIAFYQHTIYEFIFANIGTKVAKLYQLLPKSSGYNNYYNANVFPIVRNEMSSTVWRHGHSNVVGNFTNKGNPAVSYMLRNVYFNQGFLAKPSGINFQRLIQMYIKNTCERQDNWITADLSEYLFALPYGQFGLDLTCIDILRGREYGQPGCNDYREYCGLPRYNSFEEIINASIDTNAASQLSKYYYSPDDVDLYTCGLLEKPCGDSSLGPTYSCLLAEQYRWLIKGDRLWYDGEPAGFTLSQLDQIRKFGTMAHTLCLVTPQLKKVPKNAFYVTSQGNPMVSCWTLRSQFDLSAWKQ